MSPGVPTKLIAACSGLGAFAIAIVSGLSIGNPADTVLIRALVCMFVCQALGWVIGMICERTVENALDHYRSINPVPMTSTNAHSPNKVGMSDAESRAAAESY